MVIPVYDFLHRDGFFIRRIRRLFFCDPRPGHPRLARGSELSLGQLFTSLEARSPFCTGGLDGLAGSGGGFFAAGAGVSNMLFHFFYVLKPHIRFLPIVAFHLLFIPFT
jgi:hypothetical protein